MSEHSENSAAQNGGNIELTEAKDCLENNFVNDLGQPALDTLDHQIEFHQDRIHNKLNDLGLLLQDLNNMIGSQPDLPGMMAIIKRLLHDIANCDCCASLILNPDGKADLTIRGKHTSDSIVRQIERIMVDAMQHVCSRRVEIGCFHIEQHNISDCEIGPNIIQSFCNVPLIVAGTLRGMLHIGSFKADAFTADEIREIYNLAEQITAVQNNVRSLIVTEQSKLDQLILNMTDGVIITDDKGLVEIINPAGRRLMGLSDGCDLDNIGKSLESLGLKHVFSNAQQKPGRLNGEFMSKMSDQKVLQVKWSAIMNESGRFCGNVMLMRDMTAQIDLDRRQTEFIAAISHELRTPLTTIKNSVSNMLAGVTGNLNAKMSEYLKTMEGDCSRLAHLINDLLDMAKLEAGKMSINRATVNLAELATKAVRAFDNVAAQRGLHLGYHVDGLHSRVYVDKARIYQVLTNLLSNAIKYTETGGAITVRISEKDEEVVVAVEDNGVGIAPDRQQLIFTKFYQVSRQAGPGYNGSGLGLALCSELIAIHGGKMWVESELGKGSRFYFSLPRPAGELVLQKHLSALASRAKNNGQRFALLFIRLEKSPDFAESANADFGMAIESVAKALENFAVMLDDLVLRSGESEVAMIINQSGKHHLKYLKNRIAKIINEAIANSCLNRRQILPKLGIALYPGNAATIEELLEKARREVNLIS